MKAVYDEASDTLTVIFRRDPVDESDEIRPGVVADYDRERRLVAIEVLDASKQVEDPRNITVTRESDPSGGGLR